MTVEPSWRYEPCPSAAGVVHEGCYYTAHFACTKCGWTNPGHHCIPHYGTLTPDSRLRAIADAWNYDDIGQGRHEFRQQWPDLARLLDALSEATPDGL